MSHLDPDALRAHLAALVDSSDDAILSKALDGTILSWNLGAEKLYGYTAEEIVGKPISMLVPPDHPGELEDILERVQRGEVVDHFETLRTHKDGTAVPVSLTISPIKDADGNIIATSTIARDISDRTEADRFRFHLAALVDSSDDAILSKALDGTILSWNLGAEKLYGYTAEEIVGKPISMLVPPDRPGELEDILERVQRGEVVDHFETLRIHKDGTAVPVSLTISPIKDADGNIIAASTIAREGRIGDDRDRSAEDRDQRAEAHDQKSETRDERGEDRDQRAEARDEAAVSDRAAAFRDRRGAASDRMQAADDREAAAGEDRDQRAEAHDQKSETRDERGKDRDQRAEARDEAAVSDRAAAFRDRRRAASDRMQAADDREAAAGDRVISARERVVSSIDELTGAYRRTAGTLELERETVRAKRTDRPLVPCKRTGTKALKRARAVTNRITVEIDDSRLNYRP